MNLLFLASFGEVMSYIGYILLAILVLLVMITVHEFGHYISGKILGFKIDEFAIGFGPAIYKRKKKNGELFSIRVLPLGGFCAFHGEDKDITDPQAFNSKKPWKRLIVLVSGALMNYIFAVILIIVMFASYGAPTLITKNVVSDSSIPSSYSFQTDDVIITANGRNVYLISDLMGALEGKSQGDKVDFCVIRDGETEDIQIILREDADFSNVEDVDKLYKVIGAYSENDDGSIKGSLYSTFTKFGFFSTIGRSFDYSIKLGSTIFTVLGQLLTGKLGIASMGGTVTTVSITAQAIRQGGLRYLLYISSFIGVNLAVFNLLPFPALDGSRSVFTLIEWIFRKPVNRKVEGVIHTVGLVLLLLFAVFVDLQRCF